MHINQTMFKKKRFWAGILLAQILLFFLASKTAIFISFFEGIFDLQKKYHQKLFSHIPFSVGDIFYILIGLGILNFVYQLFSPQRRKKILFRALLFTNLLYLIYQIFWGLLYFQKPISDELPKVEITKIELQQLALKYLELSKKSREKVEEDQNGVFIITNLKEIESEILKAQRIENDIIFIKKGTNVNAFKKSIFGKLMSYTGILGYYNPFTAEAQYNPNLPSSYLPFTLAHESAHQLGYAREQEANFIGFLIGKNSSDPAVRYSTEFFVLKSLIRALSEHDQDIAKQMIQQFSPALKRDFIAEKMFMEKHAGLLDIFFAFTNDLFLKSNQQEGSVTYSYFVDLLIRYEKAKNF